MSTNLPKIDQDYDEMTRTWREEYSTQTVLSIGEFKFTRVDDLPEEIGLGGEQMLAVFKFPGGHKEVQFFGVQDRNPVWSGTFNGPRGLDRVRELDRMYRSGHVYELRIQDLMSRKVVIKRFEWRYKNRYEFPYEIELELAPTANNLQSLVPAQVSAPTPTAITAAPQKTYIVVAGDSLWKIAQTYYGDGSQYQKIAKANNIANPDLIQVGQKLVIP